MEKKVLIISYYWPPSGGSGVQRWLKFVKYLPQLGWTPYVFTPENPSFPVRDESLLKDVPDEAEVIHFPIWEPYDLFYKITGKVPNPSAGIDLPTSNQSTFKKIATWLRGNLLIPDPRRFWVNPSVKFLQGFLTENKIENIVTTGPPHSLHLIGLKLKKQNPKLHWVADFRDPWSEWGFLDSLRVGSLARKVHKKLERDVLQAANVVTTITPFYVRHFERLGGRKVQLLTNGFDEDDFHDVKVLRSEKFIIRHVGIVNEKCNPRPFFKAVEALVDENMSFASEVQIEFIGQVYEPVKAEVQKNELLNTRTKFINTMPHKELMKIYGNASILLLVLHGYKDAEGYMPGKLFEYIATGLPVIGVGPTNGDAASLLGHAGVGKMIDAQDVDAIKTAVLGIFDKWKKAESLQNAHAASHYSRKSLTQALTTLLKS